MDTTLPDLQGGETGHSLVHVECPAEVLESIHAEVSEAFYSVPHGGAETGGVLYGIREGSGVRITAARPLPCEHAHGPSFRLSSNDMKRLEALIEAPRRDRSLSGLAAVGWYHSHTRTELRLSDADVEIQRRYFPEQWQVALLLRPATMQATRIGYFVPDEAGGMSGPHQEAMLAAGAARKAKESAPPPSPAAAPPARPRRQSAWNSEAPAAGEGPAPEISRPVAPEPATAFDEGFPSFAVVEERRGRTWIWAVAGVLLCAAAAGLYLAGSRQSAPEPTGPVLGLRATDRDGQVEVQWDAASAAIHHARAGTLEITDGPDRQQVLLDSAFLNAGTITYTRRTEVVKFHLVVIKADGGTTDQYTTLISRPPPAKEAISAPELLPQPTQPIKQAEPERLVLPAKATVVQRPAPAPTRQFIPPQTTQATRPAVPSPAPSPGAQASSQAPPPAAKPTPVAPQPVAAAPPVVTRPASPKPEAAAAAPPPQPPAPKPQVAPKPQAAPITGQWNYSRSSPTGSPFAPESISVSIVETPSGLQGILSGRYRTSKESGLKPDVRFIFRGQPGGPDKFAWTAADGTRGEIEFIRLPNSDSVEVVWYPQNRKFVFDDVLVRGR